MFGILKRFFDFCDRENRRKFYGSIIVGLVNSFFMALRILAIAVMVAALIKTYIDKLPF